jgi:hypothetical protein
MTEPIDTTIRAADMTPAQREVFLAQCRKIAAAPKPPPAATTTQQAARDWSESERDEWLANYRRRFR